MNVRFENLRKNFGNLKAIKNADLSIFDGEIHSIVGENGAGKSTLMKILYGIHKPTQGKIFLDNKEVIISNPKKALELGIGMVHQEFMLVEDFSVYENVVLGFEPSFKGIFLRDKAKNIVRDLCDKYDIEVDVDERISNLPVGQKQKVEILKLLYRKVNFLILDEPTAVLTPSEVNSLFTTIRNFKKLGKTVVFISHKLKEVMEISDRITVMRTGEVLKTYKNIDLDIDELSFMIAGKDIKKIVRPNDTFSQSNEIVFSANKVTAYNVRREKKLDGFSLKLRKGEIYGIAGVSGNGQTELEEIISGMMKSYKGEVLLFGRNIKSMSVDRIRALGMAYIPEDRLKTGLAPIATIKENILMGYHNESRFCNALMYLKNRKIDEFVEENLNKYNIVATSINEQVGNLSGGNMQRVVIAREFEHNPDFILISHPTRGVDIGGIEFIHDKIIEMKKKGKSVLLISSDTDEILDLCDRIGVIYNGRIVYESHRDSIDLNKMSKAMLVGNDL